MAISSPVCGACFEAGTRVAEVRFTEPTVAFGHYADLTRQGKLPALCQKDEDAYYVCHRTLHVGAAAE